MPLPGEQQNPYLELEDRLAGGAISEATTPPPVATEPPPAPAPRANPYAALEDALADHENAKDALTSQLFDAAFTKAPDEHAAILEIARKTRVPAGVVEQQYPLFKAQWEASQKDPRRFREENPDMWGLLFDQPDKAPVVLQDEQISGLARVVRGVARWAGDHPLLQALGSNPNLSQADILDLEDQLAGRQGTLAERKADFSKKKDVAYELDPSGKLTGIERVLGAWAWVPVGDDEVDLQQTQPGIFQAEWRNTSKGNDAARLGSERMALRAARAALNPDVAGPQIEELNRRIWELDKRATDLESQITAKTYNAGPLEQVLVDVASIAPSQLETLKGGGVGGAAGAAIGGAAGLATRAPGAAGRLARTGYRIGSKAGAALTSFTLESGSAFNQTIGEKLDDGTFVDENVATGASIVYGAIASAIEMEAMGKALGMFGPLGDAIAKGEGRSFLRGILRDAKMRSIFSDIGKRWMKGAYAEGQEEFLQQAAQDTIDYLGRSYQAGGAQKADIVGGLEAAAEIGARTFVGTAAMGAPASTVSLGTQLMYRDRVIKAGQAVAAAVKLGKESLATRASPEFVAELVKQEAERAGEPVTNLYVDAGAFVRLFQAQGVDAEVAARELMGEGGPARLQAAIAGQNAGPDGQPRLEVPLVEYLDRWGGKPVAEALAADTTTRPGLSTTRELLARQDRIHADAQALADAWLKSPDGAPAPESAAEARLVGAVEQQLQGTGKYTPENAGRAVAVTRAFLRTQAASFGVPADVLFDQYTTTVESRGQAAPAPQAPASEALQRSWDVMSAEQRRNAMWLDWNTGVLNERALRALPADPARPLYGVIEIEGTKWANKSGHATGNALYRAAAVALHAADPEVAKVGGRFVVKVADQAALDAILARAREALPAGLQLTGAVGSDLAAADAAHVGVKQAAEAAGTRAPRGERPAGLAPVVTSAADLRLPGVPVVGAALPAALAQSAIPAAEGFDAVYVEPGTRLLTGEGFWALPRRRFIASLDLRFLKAINAEVGEPGGDAVLQVFGSILAAAGGHEFDAAHLHGDEYALQGDDEASLRGFIDTVRGMSENVVVRLEDEATGEVAELEGLHFEDGVGGAYDDAERELEARKQQRDAGVEGTRIRVLSPEEVQGDERPGGRAGGMVRGLPAAEPGRARGQGYIGGREASSEEAVAERVAAQAAADANGWTFIDPAAPYAVETFTRTEQVRANLAPAVEALADRIAAALEEPSPAPDAEVVPPITAATRFNQVQNIPEWEARVEAWMRNQGYSEKEVRGHLEAMRGQMKIFAALGPVELKELPRGRGEAAGPAWTQDPSKYGKRWTGPKAANGPLRANQDAIYVLSFDLSAMCVKRLEAAATAAWVQEKLNARRAKKGQAPRSLTQSERMALAALFRESGKAAPCLYCYVEAPRAKSSELVDKAIRIAFGQEAIPENWAPSTVELAQAALEEVKAKGLTAADADPRYFTDPEVAALPASAAKAERAPALYAFMRQMAASVTVNKPKLYEEYSGQLLTIPQEFIDARNEEAGFRFFSTSDFQFEHVADLMQAFLDLSLRGARSHAYTKVVEYAEVFGATGQKIQTSIFAKRDEAGNIVEDTWQGMGWKDAQRLRKKFADVGTVLVATDDDIVRWGLDQPWIDYIIPFHHSGLESRFFVEMGWKSYQAQQTEKDAKTGKSAGDRKIRMHELRAENGISDEELTKRYLRLAKARGLTPPFQQFADHPRYAKLRKDYARTDTPFRAVQPVFDLKKAKTVLDKYFAGEAAGANVDKKIGTKLVQMIESAPEGVDIGVEALKAAHQSRDIVTSIGRFAQSAFHGTPHRGIDRFSLEKIGTGQGAQSYGWGLYFAQNKDVAEGYRKQLSGGRLSVRGKGMSEVGALSVSTFRALERQFIQSQYAVQAQEAGEELSPDRKQELLDYTRKRNSDILLDSEVKLDVFRHQAKTAEEKGEKPAQRITSQIAVLERDVAERRMMARELADLKIEDIKLERGQTYVVDVPDPHELLDWDKPMSQQPAGVAEKLKGLLPDTLLVSTATGREVYEYLQRGYPGDEGSAAAKEFASQTLLRVGIPGLQYLDAGSRGKDGTRNLVIWDESRISIKDRLYQGGKKERAWVDVLKEGMRKVFKVMLTDQSDLSSFFHETAHTMLEMMGDLSERPDAPAKLKEDYQRTLQFLGVAGRAEVGTDQHEKFARAFEAYIMEGRAPSATLAGLFQRFRLWLLEVYRSIDALNVQLNDDIRGVFDRMLATDAEIERMKKAMGIAAPIFRSPAEAGMTPEQYQKYLADREESLSHAARQVAAQSAQARAQQTDAWWKEKRSEFLKQALSDFDRRQDALAFAYVKRGEVLTEDGRRVSAREMGRLDRAQVKKTGLLSDRLEEMLKGRIVKEDGEDLEEVAQRFGYPFGVRMLQAFLAMPDRQEWAEKEADARMQARFPDIATERDRLQEEAAKALHSDLTSDWLLKEWVALKRQSVSVMNPETGRPQVVSASTIRGHSPGLAAAEVPLEAIRQAASIIAGKSIVGHLDAGQALRAEGAAADQAAIAAAKGDFGQAYVLKQKQLLNHYLYRELAEARDAREAFLKLTGRMSEQTRRGVLGKFGLKFRDASDIILEALGLKEKETDPEALAERATMPEALKALEDAGIVPAFQAEELAAIVARPPLPPGPKQAPWQGLTVDQMKTVGMALAQLYTAARDANLVMMEGKRVQIGTLAGDIRGEAERLPKKRQPPGSDTAAPRGWWAEQQAQGISAALTDPEYLIELLGPTAYRFFWNGYLAGRQAEHELAQSVGEFFAKQWDALPEEMQRRRYDLVDASALPFPDDLLREGARRDRSWAWMLWLNMGNRSNMERLLGGYDWTEKQVRDWLQGTLSKEEVDFLQGVLDLLDKELWPKVAAQYERVNGVRPKKIENLPWTMTFLDGRTETYRGGYFPARYDAVNSRVGRDQSVEEITKKYASRAGAISVAKSFTAERVKKFTDVINLNWSIVPGHVAQVIHYVAFDSFTRDAARVLLHPDTQAAVAVHLGPKYNANLQGWLHTVATTNNDLVPQELEDMYAPFRTAKSAFVTATLGYSLSVAMGDLTNPLVTVASGKVKARYMTPALLQATNPLTYRGMRDHAMALSGELPQRAKNIRTLMRQQLAEVGRQGQQSKVWHAIRESAWVFMEWTDRLCATVIWDGAFRQALAEGKGDKDAAAWADHVVRRGLPTHNAAEQPAFLRDKRGMGSITAFYGYFAKLYTVNREIWHDPYVAWDEAGDARGALAATGETAHAAGRMLAIFFVTAVVSEFLSGRGPEDDEKWSEWVLRKLVAAPFQLLPIVSPAAEQGVNAAISKAFHGKAKYRQFSMRASPAAAAVERLVKSLARAIESQRNADQRFWDVIEVAGVGLPGTNLNIGPLGSNQVARTGRYITSGKLAADVRRGRPAEVAGGVVYGERDKGQPANPGTGLQKLMGR